MTTAEWLFTSETGFVQKEWCLSLQQQDAQPDKLKAMLKARLFGVTRCRDSVG